MGNEQVRSSYLQGSWKVVQIIANRQLIENERTHLQLEKHFTIESFQSEQQQLLNMKIFQWRKNLPTTSHVVKLYQYKILQQRFSRNQDQYIITQKILRFNQMSKLLSKPEGFLLIHHLVTGIETLFNQFGIFNVNIFCIGINNQGMGKIWLNQNFAKNHYEREDSIQYLAQNFDLVTVNNLVRLVRSRVYNEDFMPQYEFPHNMNFNQTRTYIQRIRSQCQSFNVDKIYLNRQQFRSSFAKIFNQYHNKYLVTPQNTNNQNLQILVKQPIFHLNMHYPPAHNIRQLPQIQQIQEKKLKNNQIQQTSDTISSNESSRKLQLPSKNIIQHEIVKSPSSPNYFKNFQQIHQQHQMRGNNFYNDGWPQTNKIYQNRVQMTAIDHPKIIEANYNNVNNNPFKNRVIPVNDRNNISDRRVIYHMQPQFQQPLQMGSVIQQQVYHQNRNVSLQNRNVSLERKQSQNKNQLVVEKRFNQKVIMKSPISNKTNQHVYKQRSPQKNKKVTYQYVPQKMRLNVTQNHRNFHPNTNMIQPPFQNQFNSNNENNLQIISSQTHKIRKIVKYIQLPQEQVQRLKKEQKNVFKKQNQKIKQQQAKHFHIPQQLSPVKMIQSRYAKIKQQLNQEQLQKQLKQDLLRRFSFPALQNQPQQYIHNVQMVSSMIIDREVMFGNKKHPSK